MSGFHPDAELRALARRVEQLGFKRTSPEGFHAEKSSIVAAMKRLANHIEHERADAGTHSTSFHKTARDADPRLRAPPRLKAANDNFRQAPFFKDPG